MMINDIKSFYHGKTVLVTGHTGFKGTWLSHFLIELGANVVGFSLDPQGDDCIFNLTSISDRIFDIRGDIRDSDQIMNCINFHKPDVIFHLAAQALVGESYLRPVETYNTNLMGTINLLEALKNHSKKISTVIITTDKVYKNKNKLSGYIETDELGGLDPYSSSKACVEILVDSWRNSFFSIESYPQHQKCIATARAGNVVGGGDRASNRLFPDILRAINSSHALEIRSPNSIRPWQHVLEPIYGYLLLALHLDRAPAIYSSAWNFGPNNNQIIKVKDIIRIINQNHIHIDIKEIENQLMESKQLILDSSNTIEKLQWVPSLSIEETIKLFFEWEFKNDSINKFQVTTNQINLYLNKLKK
jgi:CDP-glucose 4,6-dehydratase